MKILHTADWHIGRQFHNVSLLEDQKHVLAQVISTVKEDDVDVLIIAGDIYDRSVPSADAINLLDETLHTLIDELGVQVIVISGNHDGSDRLSFGSRQLRKSGLHIVGGLSDPIRPVIVEDEHGEVVFYPVSYFDPPTVRDVYKIDVTDFDEAFGVVVSQIHEHHNEAYPGIRKVLISHCFVSGAQTSDSERPLSVGGADQVSSSHFDQFDYAALGHLHQPQSRGGDHIRYAGSLLKYSFSEAEKDKSVTLVELGKEGQCVVEEKLLHPMKDMRVIEGKMEDILEKGLKDFCNQDYVLVRLMDKEAILDPMGKLRGVYPNTLHLEKPSLDSGRDITPNSFEMLQNGRLELFEDFYKQMTGEDLAGGQRRYIEELLDDLADTSEEELR